MIGDQMVVGAFGWVCWGLAVVIAAAIALATAPRARNRRRRRRRAGDLARALRAAGMVA